MDDRSPQKRARELVVEALRERIRRRRRRDRGRGRDDRGFSYALSLATGYRYAGYVGDGADGGCVCAARRAVDLAVTWGEGLSHLLVIVVRPGETGDRWGAPCQPCRVLLGALIRGFWVEADPGRRELRSVSGGLTSEEWSRLRSGLRDAGEGTGSEGTGERRAKEDPAGSRRG